PALPRVGDRVAGRNVADRAGSCPACARDGRDRRRERDCCAVDRAESVRDTGSRGQAAAAFAPPLGRSWTALRQGARSRPRARSGRAERPQQGHARSLSLGDSGTRGRMLVASAAPEQEGQMLFHVVWDFVDTSEEGIRRSLTLFGQWQPPAGAEFQGFYGFADGTGGVAIIEADS